MCRTAFLGLSIFFVIFVSQFVFAEDFIVQSEKVFLPGEMAKIKVKQSGSHTYEMCVWRIKEPVKFFCKQEDFARPVIESKEIREQLDAAIVKSKMPRPVQFNPNATSVETIFEYLGKQDVTVSAQEGGAGEREIEINLPGKGIYLVELRENSYSAQCVVAVSEIVMIEKRTADEVLVFVANRKDGSPVAGAKVEIYSGAEKVTEGRTAQNGVAEIKLPYRSSFRIYATINGDFTANESFFYPVAVESLKCYLYTDRPVYRPGEKVYFKGILRAFKNNGYEMPPQTKVSYAILDANKREVAKGETEMTRFGTFSGECAIGEDASLGDYTLIATVGTKKFQASFAVEKYRKPEFRVNVTTDKPHYVQGEKVVATVAAEYMFGGAVKDGKVIYTVTRSRFKTDLFADVKANMYVSKQEFEFFKEEPIKTGEGRLNQEGKFTVEFVTESLPFDCAYRVSATVYDATGAFVSGSTSTKSTMSELTLGIHTDKSLYKIEDVMKVSIKAFAYRGKSEGIKVTFSGRYTDGTMIPEQTSETDARGMVTLIVPTMRRGQLVLSASTKDSQGKPVIASTSIWVMDGVADVGFSGDWLEVVTDKDVYTVGETVQVLVVAPVSATYRFITLEGTNIIHFRTIKVSGNAQVLTLNITEEMSPNFYFCVALVNENSVLTAQKMILVLPKHKELKVGAVFNKEKYLPQDKAEVEITVTDASGNPVEAELSAGLIDESLYLIRSEATPEMLGFFYPLRRNGVGTDTSTQMPTVALARHSPYLSAFGELKTAKEELQTKDKGGFSSGGGREGRFEEESPLRAPRAAPQESAQRFRAELSRNTAEPPQEAERKSDEEVETKSKAGWIGAETVHKEARLRKEFATTVFWNAHIVTRKDGKANITVQLPDNLTEWRLTLRATTENTLVSEVRTKTETRKEVLAQVAYPRFLRQGDRIELGLIAHNRSTKDLNTRLIFEASGLTGMKLESEKILKSGGSEPLFASYKAEKAGETRLTAKVTSEVESDAVELKLPVLPRGIRKVVGASGLLKEGKAEVKLRLPDEVDIWTARLRISVNPSVHSAVIEALNYLVEYPYGCVEQTMSRFLPAVVAEHAFQKFNVKMVSLSEKLPKVLEAGLKRLYGFQHKDGGWGWWENDETNPAMTAYVVLGLALARKADVKVDESVLERAVSALKTMVERGELEYTTQAYAIYALAEAGVDVKDLVDLVFDSRRRSEANPYTKALIALALDLAGRRDDAIVVVGELENSVKKEGSYSYWGEGKTAHWSLDAIETTAFCVMALAKVNSNSDLLGASVNYLMSKREGGQWKSTKDTAACVLALTSFAEGASRTDEGVTLTILVNGKEVRNYKNANPYDAEAFIVDCSSDLLKQGTNSIEVILGSGGPVNYSAALSYLSIERRITASEAGFKVTRKYTLIKPVQKEGKVEFERVHSFSNDGIVKQGDLVLVEVTVESGENREYFMVTDYLPAGFEVDKEAERMLTTAPLPSSLHREVHDEKIVYFATALGVGKHIFSYLVRPTMKGVFSAMPAVGELMYFPDVRGNSDETLIEVR